MAVHRFKARRTGGGCAHCGYIRGNEAAHGHSCTGKMIDNAAGGATCYECGRSLSKGGPIIIGTPAYRRGY